MKFETRQQLENHVKKFCVESDYGTQQRLEEKYQRELRELRKQNVPGANSFPEEQKEPQSKPNQYAAQSLESLQEQLRNEDAEYKRLQKLAQKRRENEMDEELNKLQEERQKIRLKRDGDQQAFTELLHDLEMKKEKEIRARIEKDQIRRALMDLEKAKLSTIEQEKKRQLEALIAEREALRAKEGELMEDIQGLERNAKTLDMIRKEELDRVNGVVEGLNNKKAENKRVNEQMVVDKAEKVAALKLKREQLEGERLRIMDNLERIKNGDLNAIRKGGGVNLVTNAKQILSGMRELAGYNANTVLETIKKESLPFDPDEAYENKARPPDYMRAEYNDKYRDAQTPGGIQGFREGLEHQAKQMGSSLLDQSQLARSRVESQGRPRQNQNQMIQKSVGLNQPMSQQPYQPTQSQEQQQQLMNAWGVPIPQFSNNRFENPSTYPTQPQMMVQPNMMAIQQNQPVSLPTNIYNQWGVTPQPPQQAVFGQFALNSMMNAGPPQKNKKQAQDPWDLFSRKHEFFLQNEVRGVDLTEEERTLMSLAAQETDAMRILSRIPVGTELYRFKMEQFKELSTMRAEVEKIVQEQRLQDARREFEIERREDDRIFDNEKWVDDNRKFIIDNRLRKDNTVKKTNSGYTPSGGFVVHWDYVLGLPRRTNYSQIVFGIYNGQNVVYQPRLVDPRETETEGQNTNRIIFGDAHQVLEVYPHPDTLMIVEVQIPFSKRVEENVGRTETYGWSQIDLFDHNRQLKRGKFKLPVYYGPTDPSITTEEIQNLEPIPNCWVHLRVAYPNDKQYAITKTIYPEHTLHEYNVPYIHLRGLFGKREAVAKKQMGIMQQEEYSMRMGNKGYKMIEEVIEESELVNQTVQVQQQPMRQTKNVLDITDPAPPMQSYKQDDDEKLNLSGGKQKKKGLRIIIYKIENHQARSQLRVMCNFLEEGTIVLDDNGLPVAFNTTIHNPLDLRPENRQSLPVDFIVPLPTLNPGDNGMNNKAKGADIIFQEEYRVWRNVYAMFRKNKKDLFVGFQVVEKPEPQELQANKLEDTQKNYAGLEFEPLGWQFLKINESDGTFLSGRFKQRLNKPPMRRPPIDPTKVQELDIYIDYALHEFEYDDKDLIEFKKQAKKKKQVIKKAPELEDVPLDNSAFIQNNTAQWSNRPFEKRMGIDFYIDAIRFAPDKVSYCKVYLEVWNRRYERIFDADVARPDLNTMSYMPQYNYRRELRAERFDPTSVALITIVTFDKATQENRIVGYAAIQLFLSPLTKQQPDNHNENDFVLYNGNYQLPVFSQQLDRTPPFDIRKIYSHEKSPCCSILVRIRQAPLSDDGLRTLSINDFPDPKKQVELGLLVPRPNYGQGVYNTDNCSITESEKELFAQRVLRADVTVREAVFVLVKGDQNNKELKDKELIKYIDDRVSFGGNTFMIDMMYFAKYRPQAGFKFVVDGLHNVSNKKNAYVVFYSLSKPGSFYVEPRDVSQAHMTSTYDWDSFANSPQYTDEWFTFRENAERYQNIIIDIKSVPLSKIDDKITDVGWTILPIFSPDGYIQSNIYQLPLFKGAIPRRVITDLEKQDAWDYLRDQVKKKGIFYLEYMSVIVRLVDSQREGHFRKRFDCDRLEYRYLPAETVKSWSYNPAVELKLTQENDQIKKYIPFKDNPSAYNRKITDYFANSLGLKQYLSS